MSQEKFREWVIKERSAQQLKPAELARKATVSKSVISKFESGQTEITLNNALSIGRVLGQGVVWVKLLLDKDIAISDLKDVEKQYLRVIMAATPPQQLALKDYLDNIERENTGS